MPCQVRLRTISTVAPDPASHREQSRARCSSTPRAPPGLIRQRSRAIPSRARCGVSGGTPGAIPLRKRRSVSASGVSTSAGTARHRRRARSEHHRRHAQHRRQAKSEHRPPPPGRAPGQERTPLPDQSGIGTGSRANIPPGTARHRHQARSKHRRQSSAAQAPRQEQAPLPEQCGTGSRSGASATAETARHRRQVRSGGVSWPSGPTRQERPLRQRQPRQRDRAGTRRSPRRLAEAQRHHRASARALVA